MVFLSFPEEYNSEEELMMKQTVIDDTLLDALDMNVDSMISDLVSLVAIKDGIDGL